MNDRIAKPQMPQRAPTPRLLLIGIADGQSAAAADSVAFSALNHEMLWQLQPDLVVFPLFGHGHDAIAVIERLQELAYAGQMTVLCPQLPKPELVAAELRQLGFGARLTLMIVDPDQTPGLSAR